LGMWPRLAVSIGIEGGPGFETTPYCAFSFFAQDRVSFLSTNFSLVIEPPPEGRRAVEVGSGSRVELLGASNASPPEAFTDDVVGFSRVSAYHWSPSIAPADGGAAWYAFGNGVLHLAQVRDLEVTDSIVDIDRTTGFLPQLAVRRKTSGLGFGTPVL